MEGTGGRRRREKVEGEGGRRRGRGGKGGKGDRWRMRKKETRENNQRRRTRLPDGIANAWAQAQLKDLAQAVGHRAQG